MSVCSMSLMALALTNLWAWGTGSNRGHLPVVRLATVPPHKEKPRAVLDAVLPVPVNCDCPPAPPCLSPTRHTVHPFKV